MQDFFSVQYFLHNIKVVSVICLIAYLLTKNPSFARSIRRISTKKEDKILLAIQFGALSIVGNILGVVIFNNVMIESSLIGPVAGGLIAGPFVGIAAGLIGGIYKFFMPGFLYAPAFISNIFAGAVGGFFYHKFREKRLTFLKALIAGVIAEIIWIALVLLLAKPFILAKAFVGMISFTTTIINPLGIAIFIMFVKDIQYSRNLVGASYAEKALEIAKQTLPILKYGFNMNSAKRIAEIIYSLAGIDAIAVTDTVKILAFKGAGEDHHTPGAAMLTTFTRNAIEYDTPNFDVYVANSKTDIGCPVKNCPLDVCIVAPLICNQEIVGYIKFYKVRNFISEPDIKMASGIASLLSLQLEKARLDEQAKLLAKAEYYALRAQINPHFLFNTLNVIKLLIRTDANQAREVILNLATFFRKTLNRSDDIMPFAEEVDTVKLYVSIQKVRFGERLQVDFNISDDCNELMFPAFALQPLVENSMNHGLSKKTGLLSINIEAKVNDEFFIVDITDNGLGFPMEVIEAVRHDYMLKEMGIGLTNINHRLKSLYGNRYGFNLENTIDGAKVVIKIPRAA